MLFGKETVTEFTDSNGSKQVTETSYFKGKPELPVRITTETRIKVTNQTQEFEEYKKFSDQLADKKKLDPVFKIERTSAGDAKGYYYVVGAYTMLKY